jgi:O-antigen/teichoic acid export membrane protein
MFSRFLRLVKALPSDRLLRVSAFMMVVHALASVFNYLYQVLMANFLSPVEYGVLSSLLAMLAIVSIVAPSIQLAAARITSVSFGTDQQSEARPLWTYLLKRTFFAGLVVTLLSLLLIPAASTVVHVDRLGLFVILAFSFLFTFLLSVNLGMLQGLQWFIPLGWANLSTPLLRIVLGASFVYMGLGVYGALLPILIGTALVFAVTLLPYFRLPGTGVRPEKVGLASYASWTTLAFGSFIVLANMDVVLARHYLDAFSAGEYAAIAVLGRVVQFAPFGVIIVMFPKTANPDQTQRSRMKILGAALAVTFLTSGLVVALYGLFGDVIVSSILSDDYRGTTPYLLKYGLGMLGLSLQWLLLQYFLSINRIYVGFIILATMVFQFALTAAFHADINQLVNIRLATGVLAVVLLVGFGIFGGSLPFFKVDRAADAA